MPSETRVEDPPTQPDAKLLLIDTHPETRQDIAAQLHDYQLEIAASGQNAVSLLEEYSPDLVLCDYQAVTSEGTPLVEWLAAQSTPTPLLILCEWGLAWRAAMDCVRLGAGNYFIKPVTNYQALRHGIAKELERLNLQRENLRYREQLEQTNRELRSSLQQLRRDQLAGRYVQMKMLPAARQNLNGYVFSHRIIPSLLLSGDWVDYFQITSQRLFFLIADVSGHGASSALVTVILKSFTERLLERCIHHGEENLFEPAQFLREANLKLIENRHLDKHVTMFAGLIDTVRHDLFYATAGHYPSPILMAGGKAHYLRGRGLPIGLDAEASYEQRRKCLKRSSKIALLSDGILDMLNLPTLAQKERRLLELMQNDIHEAEDLVQAFSLQEARETPDDITLMMISGHGEQGAR